MRTRRSRGRFQFVLVAVGFFSSCLHHVDVVTDDPHRCHSVEHIASILTATDVSSFTLRRFCKWR